MSEKERTSSIILILIAFLLTQSVLVSQSKSVGKKKLFPDVSMFSNSAHHWYDINDDDKVIEPMPDQAKYDVSEISKIADNILLYQKNNGGWPKNYDMLAILSDQQKEALQNVKGIFNTTFDNWTTHSHIEYLAKAYAITKSEKYKDACLRGLDFILSAQYQNGGWPQFYPEMKGYGKYITFNDGVMTEIMNVLKKIIERKPYYSFVDSTLVVKIKNSYNKGLECILKCQIKENGKLNAWCQQHDNVDLRPQWARTFEPASICNGESAGIVKFLMSIKNPGKEIINSIQSAVKWFNESKILGIKVVTIDAQTEEFKWRRSGTDKVVVNDPKAPPIWTRFYELGTHKPLFCNRDGKVVYSLAEVERERRDGYGWYTYDPQQILDLYPKWQKRWAPNENALQH